MAKFLKKICLKATRDTFFPICAELEYRGTQFFGGGYIQQNKKNQTFVGLQGVLQISSLSGTFLVGFPR